MAKRTSVKNIKNKNKYIIWAILILIIVAQVIIGSYIFKLYEFADLQSNNSLRSLLIEAEERRYKYPVIDVSEDRVYIPEARIYVPLNDTTRNLRYNYETSGSLDLRLIISDSSVVGRQTNENYVMCDRIAAITNSDDPAFAGVEPVGHIDSSEDEFTEIHAFKNGSCWNQEVYDKLVRDVVKSIKQAKNY